MFTVIHLLNDMPIGTMIVSRLIIKEQLVGLWPNSRKSPPLSKTVVIILPNTLACKITLTIKTNHFIF